MVCGADRVILGEKAVSVLTLCCEKAVSVLTLL